MSKSSKPFLDGKKHKTCPSLARKCTCLLPTISSFFVCCGYWCTKCGLHLEKVPK